MKKIAVIVTLLILMLAVPAGTTHAAQIFDRVIAAGETVSEDVAIWGSSLKVEEGGTVDGDVSVFGGTAVLNGRVTGDVVVFGGTATMAGAVDGDLVLFGGTLSTASSADVDGECVLIGGTFEGDSANSFSCNAVGEFPDFVKSFTPPRAPELPLLTGGRSVFTTISVAAGQSLVFGILALVAAAVLPYHLNEVSRSLKRRPAASGAVGLLTLMAMISAIVLLGSLSAVLILACGIGLLGFPIVIALVAALGAALLLGWIGAGAWLGERLAVWLKLENRSLTVTTALGTAVLTVVAALLRGLPFLLGGWLWSLLAFLVACAGLGAVALTRFGTRPYPAGALEPAADKVAQAVEMMPDDEDLSPKSPQ